MGFLQRTRRAGVAVLGAAALALGLCGCRTPDVAPMAEATGSLQAGIVEAGRIAGARVRSDGRIVSAEELGEQWAVRVQAAQALADYAFALTQLVEAGEESRRGVDRLAGTLEVFRGKLPAAGEFQALAAVIGKAVSNMAVLASLSRAVEAAHPAIVGICDVLKADSADLLAPYEEAYSAALRVIRDDRYQMQATLRLRAGARLNAATREMVAYIAGGKKLSEPDGVALLEDLQRLREVIAGADQQLAPYRERVAALDAERAALTMLLERVGLAADAVVRTHSGLSEAIKEGRAPDSRTLLAEAREVARLIDQLREARARARLAASPGA